MDKIEEQEEFLTDEDFFIDDGFEYSLIRDITHSIIIPVIAIIGLITVSVIAFLLF